MSTAVDDELQRSHALVESFVLLMQTIGDVSSDDASLVSAVAEHLHERAEERWETRLVDDAVRSAMHHAVEQVAEAVHRTRFGSLEFGADNGAAYRARRDARRLLIKALS